MLRNSHHVEYLWNADKKADFINTSLPFQYVQIIHSNQKQKGVNHILNIFNKHCMHLIAS